MPTNQWGFAKYIACRSYLDYTYFEHSRLYKCNTSVTMELSQGMNTFGTVYKRIEHVQQSGLKNANKIHLSGINSVFIFNTCFKIKDTQHLGYQRGNGFNMRPLTNILISLTTILHFIQQGNVLLHTCLKGSMRFESTFFCRQNSH